MQTALANPGLISLAAGFVDQDSLPVEATARAVAAILGDPLEGRRALQYGTTRGDAGLRQRLVAQLERNEGVPAGTFRDVASRMVVTTGSAQLLYLVAEALLDPGDIVLVESPTYFVFLGVLETRGARAIGIETDSEGLRLDALEETLADLEAQGLLDRVKLIYTVSEHANPTGNSLAEGRRGPLVELARRWSKEGRIFILEDAAYRGLSFAEAEPPSVWSHDEPGDTVILARTFSKTLSPGLKTGYGILPESLVEPVLRLKGNHDFGTANFDQRILEHLMADGSYDRHVEGLVALYRRKRDVMLGALERPFRPARRRVVDPAFGGALRLALGAGGARHGPRRPALRALPGRGGPLRPGGVRLRRDARADPDPTRTPLLRRARRGRPRRRGPPPGRRDDRLPRSRRLNLPRGRTIRPTGERGFSWDMDAKGETPLSWGILQRYVMGEVVRAFALALLTITAVFVLFVVMAEASRMGLTPQDISRLVPYVIPSSLPYTIPVSLLFAVTVVYGRMASDNEVVAVKTAGLSAWTLLWPAILFGLGLSVLLIYLSSAPIPRANHLAKQAIFKDMEEMFYKVLKKNRELDRPNWPFLIKVDDVEGKTLIGATFKHRASRTAKDAASIRSEGPGREGGQAGGWRPGVRPHRHGQGGDHHLRQHEGGGARPPRRRGDPDQRQAVRRHALINNQPLRMPFPDKGDPNALKKVQEWTTAELDAEQAKFRSLVAKERKRQATAAALWIASGRIQRVNWKQFQKAFVDYRFWEQKCFEYETEKQMRVALSFGSFFFVLLGAPVGILFARRDFLSAFISCFLPIIILYYPLTLFGVNMGKEGIINPTVALWVGNSALALLAGFVWHPIMKH